MAETEETVKQSISTQVPDEVWKALITYLRPKPFYKRHPFLFVIAILLVLAIFAGIFLPGEKEEPLAVSEDSLALIVVKGVILDTQEIRKWIRAVELNPRIKGAILRVDSPGGGASASQELFACLRQLAKKKPLVVSMGSVAASGGLMVSMAGEKIFANASTITGSIGVRMDIPQVKALLDKIGVSQETLVTGPFKDAGSSLRPLSDEDRSYLLGILSDLHAQFVDTIVTGRGMSEEAAKKLATGRIFTGKEAKSLGLVDEIGTQEDAHRYLSEKTNISYEKKLITKPKRFSLYEEFILSILPSWLFDIGSKTTPFVRYQW